jgi:hypothetical protein
LEMSNELDNEHWTKLIGALAQLYIG